MPHWFSFIINIDSKYLLEILVFVEGNQELQNVDVMFRTAAGGRKQCSRHVILAILGQVLNMHITGSVAD